MDALYFLIIKNMKRFLVIILANLCALVNLMAQDDYVPTTTWPYIYPEFMNGEIMTGNGSTTKGLFNVCLADSQLHYIDGDLVKKATILDLQGVTIGKDTYVYADFNLYKVLSKSGSAVVAEGYSIDMAKLNGSEGAYGSSGSTLATQSLSSLEGIGGNRTNMNHMDLRNSKDSGKYLPIIERMYLVFNKTVVPATRKDVLAYASDKGFKPEAEKFIKENKIKWNQQVSLQALADFLSSR